MRIFLSYGHDDYQALSFEVCKDLRQRGHEVWIDKENIKPGEDWAECISRGLDWAAEGGSDSRMVLMMTPHAVRRPEGFCLRELTRALEKRIKVVPVMVVWTEPPIVICHIQWLDMANCVKIDRNGASHEILPGTYRANLERLVDAITTPGKLDFDGTQTKFTGDLKPLSFDAELQYFSERFVGREWVFDAIESWIQSAFGPARKTDASRVFWMVGKPGVGKTALAVKLATERREVIATHLCNYGVSEKVDPKRCVMSIAYQMSTQLPDYRQLLVHMHLEGIVEHADARTLFDVLIVQPLCRIAPPNRHYIIVLDAVDEATQNEQNTLVELIAREFPKTPDWLGLILTSRNEKEVLRPLRRLSPFVLETDGEDNITDLKAYLSAVLRDELAANEDADRVLDEVIDKSEGVFIYVKHVAEEVRLERLSVDRINEFPAGMSTVFDKFFSRQFPDIKSFRNEVRPALRLILAAREPLPLRLLQDFLGWARDELNDFVTGLGTLFSVTTRNDSDEEVIEPFHKSLADWLMASERSGKYFCDVVKGHSDLAELGQKKLESFGANLSGYHRCHLAAHSLLGGNYDLSIQLIVADPDFWPLVRTALTEVFRGFDQWPMEFVNALRSHSHPRATVFLGDSYDMESRYEEAIKIFEDLRQRTSLEDGEVYCTARVRLATEYDRNKQPEKAREILEELLSEGSGVRSVCKKNFWWAKYQYAIVLRRLGRLFEAEKELHLIRFSDEAGPHQVGTLHQQGVIDLKRMRLDDAFHKFELCLEQRHNDPNDHRCAFEYHRMGEVHSHRGNEEGARACFQEAIEISRRTGNLRYIEAVTETATTCQIKLPQ